MTLIGGSPTVSRDNSTNTALGVGGVFTGDWDNAWQFASLMVALKSDQDGTLTVQFSPDKVNIDSTLNYSCAASVNEVHRLSVSRQFCRIVYTNGSVAQTYFRMQTILGQTTALTSPVNTSIQADADGMVVRAIDTELDVAAGRFLGYSIINKFGKNAAVSTADVPEDVWSGGGVYTGFPTGSAELVTVVSSSDLDTSNGSGARSVRLYGQLNGVEQTEDITLNGTTPVDSTRTWTRIYRVRVMTSGSSNTAFNAGLITTAHKVTTANIFSVMQIGVNQSQLGAYTIPLGKTGYIRKIQLDIERANTVVVSAGLWVRESGSPPRILRPFSASNSTEHSDTIYGGLVLPALTDVTVRITACSANNVSMTTNFDLILVDD